MKSKAKTKKETPVIEYAYIEPKTEAEKEDAERRLDNAYDILFRAVEEMEELEVETKNNGV